MHSWKWSLSLSTPGHKKATKNFRDCNFEMSLRNSRGHGWWAPSRRACSRSETRAIIEDAYIPACSVIRAARETETKLVGRKSARPRRRTALSLYLCPSCSRACLASSARGRSFRRAWRRPINKTTSALVGEEKRARELAAAAAAAKAHPKSTHRGNFHLSAQTRRSSLSLSLSLYLLCSLSLSQAHRFDLLSLFDSRSKP